MGPWSGAAQTSLPACEPWGCSPSVLPTKLRPLQMAHPRRQGPAQPLPGADPPGSPAAPPSVHHGEKGSHRLDHPPPQRQKTCTAAPSPPGCRSRSLRGSQRAQHPREASRATPKKAGVPRGAPPPAPSEQPLASLLCTHAIWGPWTNLVLQAPHLQEDRPQPPKPRRECRSVTRWPEERSTPLHLPPPRPRPCRACPLCLSSPIPQAALTLPARHHDPRGIERWPSAQPGACAIGTREEPRLGSSGLHCPPEGPCRRRPPRACAWHPQPSSPSSSEHQRAAHSRLPNPSPAEQDPVAPTATCDHGQRTRVSNLPWGRPLSGHCPSPGPRTQLQQEARCSPPATSGLRG